LPERSAAAASLAVALLLVAALFGGRGFLAPFTLSVFVSLLLLPVVQWLKARRFSPVVAFLFPVTGMLLAVLIAVLLAAGALAEIQDTGPRYARALEERVGYTVDWWAQRGVDIRGFLPSEGALREKVVVWATSVAHGTVRFVTKLILILITSIFLLFEFVRFDLRTSRLPPAVQKRLLHFLRISGFVQRYLWIKTLMAMGIGLAAFAWLAFLEVDLALLFGLLAFLLHFVPNLGAFLAALPPMLLALVQHDPARMLAVGLGYFGIGMVLGNLLEPALLGRKLGMSPFAVWLSLLFWGWLWGPIGMFLSVPLTLAMMEGLRQSPKHAWIAVLLEGRGNPRAAPEDSGVSKEASALSLERRSSCPSEGGR
jgi:predicted PurR-regulated permease PerM